MDFSRIPIGRHTEVIVQRTLTLEIASQVADEGCFNFTIRAKTGLLQVWMLLPEGREYDAFEVSGYPVGNPELAQIVVPHSTARVAFGSIAIFRLIDPDSNCRYECRWK